MKNIILSIIVPFYNTAFFFEECIQSILAHKNINLELILINDGSTDNSIAIAKRNLKKDPRVVLHNFENAGLSVARNRGLAIAQGKYVMFVDSDDKLVYGSLYSLIEFTKANSLDCCLYSGDSFYNTPEDVNISKAITYKKSENLTGLIKSGRALFCDMVFSNSNVSSACMYIFKRNSLGEIQFYPNIYHEDDLFSANMLFQKTMAKVAIIDLPVYLRRLRANSITTEPKSVRHIIGYHTVYNELRKLKTNNFKEWLAIQLFSFSRLRQISITSKHPTLTYTNKKKKQWHKIIVIEYFNNPLYFYRPGCFFSNLKAMTKNK